MPPRSPLPTRHGLQAAWVRTPDRDPSNPRPWPTMGDFLRTKLAREAPVDRMLADGRFVDQDGRPWSGTEPYRPHTFVWFHRDLRAEPPVPFEIPILYADERLVVVDKPHFLSTIPRGRHVTESVVVRLRERLGLAELSPAHRLDRLTAGVLVLTTERRWRAAYQQVFENRQVTKSYEALAGYRPELAFPRTVSSHLSKVRGRLQAFEVPGAEPNAHTTIELLEHRGQTARYRLLPHTGKTHQLRVHLNSLGIPILGDPLYPEVLEVSIDDFGTPLCLIARGLSFNDPLDGTPRRFESARTLPWPAPTKDA